MAQRGISRDDLTERGCYWQALLAEQAASGLSQTAFCRRRGVNPGTFAWWKNRLRHPRNSPAAGPVAARGSQSRPVFREIAGAVRLAGPASFEVLLGSGRTVRVPAGFDQTDLRRLLGVLEAAC